MNDKNEITFVDENRMIVTNHGAIVYVDANGEEHSFSGFPDLENYIIQNYDVTVVDYNKYVEDGSIVAVDAVTTPVSNTTATSYFTGDVTGDGAVDLMDAISLNKIFAGFIAPTDVQNNAADINLDGSVTDDDLSILMQFLIGIRSDLTDVD
ncbi:MAG: dockerin type I repeat-containing protein [Ruminococcus sp.]|nr:dockerin type I repeat-containing protein [Ruminococcus sp.]